MGMVVLYIRWDLRHESVCNLWVSRRIGQVHGVSCGADSDAKRMTVDK